MYLIIGLGNPEEEYSQTRHNMGFDVINKLANKYDIGVNKKQFQALCGTGSIEGEKVMLVKPQTYMNESGESIIQFVNFYKVEFDKIIVIYDDMDVDEGTIKIRKKGGPGTHNGMKSIVKKLNSQNFARIRVGTGKTEKTSDLINFVIGKLKDEEYEKLKPGISLAVEAIQTILTNGIDNAMNKLN